MSEPSANKPESGRRTGTSEPQSGQPDPDFLDAFPTIKGLRPGERLFQHYELRRMLGKGGMGVVWLAWDEQLEEEVALKFLPEIFSSDRLALDDLKREAKRSRKLAHPNIVRIHSFEQDERCAGISMEYVDGDTLSNVRLERGDRSYRVEELVPIMRQLCLALSHAHDEAKIVHRDLKPANLMLTQTGQLKVADFGLASTLNQSLSLISMPRGGGTLAYMSPQQLYGELPSVTDDIYALGATMYDLLTGKPPFFGGDVTLQIRDKQPSPMHARREALGLESANIPADWEAVVAACLAKKPEDRPASVTEIAVRLGLIPGVPMKAPAPVIVGPELDEPPLDEAPPKPPTPAKLIETPVPQRRVVPPPQPVEPPHGGRGAILAVVLIALLMGAGAGWWFGIEQPRKERVRLANIHALETKIADALNAALTALDNKRFEEARSSYQDVLVLDAGNVAAKEGLENVDNAEADSRSIKKKNIETGAVLAKAVAERQRAQEIADSLKAAQTAFEESRYPEARKAYDKVATLDAGNKAAQEGLGKILIAEAAVQKKKIEAVLATAQSALNAGLHSEAKWAYNEVLTQDPGNLTAKEGLANAQKAEAEARQKAEAKAKQMADDLARQNAAAEAARLVKSGRAMVKNNEFTKAEKEAKLALEAVPGFPDAKKLLDEIADARKSSTSKGKVNRVIKRPPTPVPPNIGKFINV